MYTNCCLHYFITNSNCVFQSKKYPDIISRPYCHAVIYMGAFGSTWHKDKYKHTSPQLVTDDIKQ